MVAEVVPDMMAERVAQDVEVTFAPHMTGEGVSRSLEKLERGTFIPVLESSSRGVAKDRAHPMAMKDRCRSDADKCAIQLRDTKGLSIR